MSPSSAARPLDAPTAATDRLDLLDALRGFALFGPAEWLWRSLTYGQRQPMRLRAEVAPALT